MSSPSAPASAAGGLAIDIRQLPWISRLAADYAFAFEDLAPFYAGDPRRPDAWAEVIARVHATPRAVPALSSMLLAQLAAREAPPAAREAAAAFERPGTVAVLTGQQAGLFGGPLYTLHKALTAIKLARQISATHGVTAVPVFWIDSEDHDWEEVRRCTGPRRRPGAADRHRGRCRRRRRAADCPADARRPGRPGDRGLERGAAGRPTSRLRCWRCCAAPTPRAAACPRRSVSSSIRRSARTAWSSTTPPTPHAKPLARPLFERAIDDPGRTSALAAAAGAALEAKGYHAQVSPADQAAPLFLIDGTRRAIRFRGDVAVVGDDELPLADLAALARTAPERFSPNVLLRPLVQDTIFPTVCYVGGPSELAYLGQLRDVYAHFGVPMPLVVPRASASVVDSAALRFLAKHDIPFHQFQRQDELTLNQLLESQLPKAVEVSFADADAAVLARLEAVTAAARTVDPTLEGAAKATLGKMQHDLQALHGKVVHAAKKKDETLRRQFTRTQTQLFPNGEPQERELGIVWLLNRYGSATVDRLLDMLPIDAGHHWVLTI